jgi:hypothetical protein
MNHTNNFLAPNWEETTETEKLKQQDVVESLEKEIQETFKSKLDEELDKPRVKKVKKRKLSLSLQSHRNLFQQYAMFKQLGLKRPRSKELKGHPKKRFKRNDYHKDDD